MSRSIRLAVLAALTLAAVAVPAAANAASATYIPTAYNFDTGIDVESGDVIGATATSDFNLCGGQRPCIDATFEDGRIAPTAYPVGPPFSIPTAGAGGGFYRIGSGNWVAFTASPDSRSVSNPVVATSSGRLFITTNDIPAPHCASFNSPNGCYADNVGSIAVVTVPDSDGDGVRNTTDNCPTDANPGQGDQDGDGQGDACDPDVDGDGVANGSDNCPTDANPGQADQDSDGVGTACDDVELPSTKDQCKKDGWKNWYDGTKVFKNQGDCVSYVATGGKNGPSGS